MDAGVDTVSTIVYVTFSKFLDFCYFYFFICLEILIYNERMASFKNILPEARNSFIFAMKRNNFCSITGRKTMHKLPVTARGKESAGFTEGADAQI